MADYIDLPVEGGGSGAASSVTPVPLPSNDPADILVSYSPTLGTLSDAGVLASAVLFQGGNIIEQYVSTAVSTIIGANLIGVTSTAAIRTITLPTSMVANVGQIITIKDESGGAGTHNITIDTQGTEKIDGQDSIAITVNYGCLRVYSNGSNWFTI